MLPIFLIVLYKNIYFPEYLTSWTQTCTTKLLNSANQQGMGIKSEDIKTYICFFTSYGKHSVVVCILFI